MTAAEVLELERRPAVDRTPSPDMWTLCSHLAARGRVRATDLMESLSRVMRLERAEHTLRRALEEDLVRMRPARRALPVPSVEYEVTAVGLLVGLRKYDQAAW